MQVELRTALTAAIDELPATYRSVLGLRDVEGRSNPEIAQALGLSLPVVKTRVHRARLFLRKRLGDYMTVSGQATATACASQGWTRPCSRTSPGAGPAPGLE